jgi:hypothetical protein
MWKANPGGTGHGCTDGGPDLSTNLLLGVRIVRESRQRREGLDGGESRPYESVLGVAGKANTNAAWSMKKSNSRPPRDFIHMCHSMPACSAAMKIGFGGVHEGERVRQRRPEPRFGSDGDHGEERYGVRIVESACCRAMKRAGVMVEVKDQVREAADTVVEERMEGNEGML